MIASKKQNEFVAETAGLELPERLRFSPKDGDDGLIRFLNVTLPPAIRDLSLEIKPRSWVMLYGEDDFAKALFCDLCFGYIYPEQGAVNPGMKGSDVSFLGRSNNTYGHSLVDHLICGTRTKRRELLEFAVKHALTARFHRHLEAGTMDFTSGKAAQDMELDERDFLELAEANVLLQERPAVVIDTTTDFYQIAIEQGFRHSDAFLGSGKTLIWLVRDREPLPADACAWVLPHYKKVTKLSLSFPDGSPAGHIN